MKTRIYQNKENEHKFVQVKIYKDGHIYIKPFMFWYTQGGIVINYLGSRSNRGCSHRVTKNTLNKILTDYVICYFGYLK